MCLNSLKRSPCSSPLYFALRSRKPSRGCNLQYCRLSRRRRTARQLRQSKEKKKEGILKKEMEIKNLKLYMKNKSIIEENEKLRKKAYFLNQENQALLIQLQKKFSKSSAVSQQQSQTITL
ncbi:protein LITTLE ZIPPER 2 [Ricinus communis]|uniref:Uncharacterized protein n=1 Tax=Ricinus communis TaxID=3988 RepID=B9RDE7_RICCO|nr:protein LITTLE ZIPPER 2 [Ricinus communis]EEF50405.1 conserved hypothetical protein [Ricinus communis]|eukprot:XP_002511736.1 protein LITTLE ZIPPER 2 [Ricinus communis]